MDLEKIKAYKDQQAQDAKESKLIDTIVGVGDSVSGSISSASNKVQKVDIQNKVATTADIDAVIKQLKEVQLASLLSGNKSSVVLADSTDLGEAVSSLGSKLDSLAKSLETEKSDKELIKTVKSELQKVVDALAKDTDSELIAAVKDLKTGLDGINVEPVVNVPQPNVTVDVPKIDFKPLITKLDSVVKAVGNIKPPVFDTTDLLIKIDNVSKTINGLQFPVPNFVQDPYIRYKAVDEFDDGVSTNVKYFGFLSPEGNWYILKYDPSASAKTYRYAFGDSGYEAAWTGRASLAYGYPNGR